MSRIADRHFHQLLQEQQSILAGQWQHVISQSSFVSLDPAALEREVASLAKRTVDALLAEPFSQSEARAIGMTLAGLRYMTPETLRRMVEWLGEQLAEALPGRELAALHPCLTALVAGLMAGFLEQEHAMTMEQQNAMRQATLDSRRQAEEAVRASEARYRAVVTNVAEGIALADGVTHRILETNPALQQLLGYTAEELSDMSLYEIVAHERRSVDENIRQAVGKGRHDIQGRQCRRKDGTLVTVEASITALEVAGGVLLCSVVRDVTQRAQAAAERAEAQRRLAAASEQERLCLSQELHDGTVQELLGLRLQVAAAARSATRGEPAPSFVPALSEVEERMADVVRQLRGLITELRPTGLEERGLPRALENYVAGLHLAGGTPEVALNVDPDLERLAPEVALCLFRVAQEVVRNALAHGRPRRVVVRARLRTRQVILRVGDDGCGFEVPERLSALAAEGHFGLLGMAERVISAGGRLRVRSRLGRGTTVTAWMPLSAIERGGGNDGNPSSGR